MLSKVDYIAYYIKQRTHSIKGVRKVSGICFAFSVSQLFITNHNNSEVQVVPDENSFESCFSDQNDTFYNYFTAFGEGKQPDVVLSWWQPVKLLCVTSIRRSHDEFAWFTLHKPRCVTGILPSEAF